MKEKGDLGLYLHVPFCKSKCAYCDFYSLPHAEDLMDDYLRALTEHLAEVAPHFTAQRVDTVYVGGGTPSYFGVKRLEKLLSTVKKYYKVDRAAEVTVEMNPATAEIGLLKKLRRAGVNRLSIGMQSSHNHELAALSPKTVELISLAVGAALRCDHCTSYHMHVAQKMDDEGDASVDFLFGHVLSQRFCSWNNIKSFPR